MSIRRNRRDITTALAKSVVGALPFVGSLATEVISTLIPNQRIDRIADYVVKLDEKVRGIEEEQLMRRFTTPESIDLFEDSLYQVSRTLSEERRGYIASLFKNSLTDDQLEHIHYKQLLSILGELNDVEVLILKLESLGSIGDKDEFYKQHENALKPPHATFGAPQEDIDKDTIYQTYKAHLERLGLITVSEIGSGTSSLGRLLLSKINQEGEY